MSRIEEVNRIPQIKKVIKELNKKQLQIGIFAPEGSELFIKAVVNEYGADIVVTPAMRAYLHYNGLHLKDSTTHIKVPERSFIRTGYENAKDDIEKLLRGLIPRVIKLKMTPKQMYETIGEYVVGQIHEYLASVTEPPNHPYTVEKKGSSKPLIDTGHLNQKITWRVVDR